MEKLLTVSSAARILGKADATIRYYERIGRLKASRTESGTRLFQRADVERLAAELRAKAEGSR